MKELKEYPWPELTAADAAFPSMKPDETLIRLSREKPYQKGRKAFSTLFFKGGKLTFSESRKNLGLEPWEEKALSYALVMRGSFAPKHEDKESVCAMIFEELEVSVQEVKE